MTNVYIKSFNRPFYLDRCIRSVKFNVKNYEKIIVLDDGTLSKYLERLRVLHPDVEIKGSGATDDKVALLRAERFKEIQQTCPSAPAFWVAEIGKDPFDHILVLEDDAWVVRQFDLAAIVRNMNENDAMIVKLWWSTEANQVAETFDYPNGFSIQYIAPTLGSMFETYQIWIVAFAIFRRDYWLNNVAVAQRLADEGSQLVSALEYVRRHPTRRAAITGSRGVHQGWMVPGRSTPEYYDLGLRQHVLMDAMNEAWLAGRLDVTQGYPYDFSDDYMRSVIQRTIGAHDYEIWRQWRKGIHYFYDRA